MIKHSIYINLLKTIVYAKQGYILKAYINTHNYKTIKNALMTDLNLIININVIRSKHKV